MIILKCFDTLSTYMNKQNCQVPDPKHWKKNYLTLIIHVITTTKIQHIVISLVKTKMGFSYRLIN